MCAAKKNFAITLCHPRLHTKSKNNKSKRIIFKQKNQKKKKRIKTENLKSNILLMASVDGDLIQADSCVENSKIKRKKKTVFCAKHTSELFRHTHIGAHAHRTVSHDSATHCINSEGFKNASHRMPRVGGPQSREHRKKNEAKLNRNSLFSLSTERQWCGCRDAGDHATVCCGTKNDSDKIIIKEKRFRANRMPRIKNSSNACTDA